MPHLVPLVSIPVTRKGLRVVPTIGMSFEFTRDEAAELNEKYYRPANSADPLCVAPLRAVSGQVVASTSRRNREAISALADAAKSLAAAADARAEKGTAAVPRRKSTEPAAVEDGDEGL